MSGSNWYSDTYLNLRGSIDVVADNSLDRKDVDLIIDVLEMRYWLYTDLTMGSTQQDRTCTVLRRSLKGLRTLNVSRYASDWKVAREILTSSELLRVYPDVAACQKQFKAASVGRIHYKWIRTSILMLMDGEDWFCTVNQWVTFDARLNLKSLDLTSQECLDLLDFEEKMSRWVYPSDDVPVLRLCAKELVGDFYITDYPFRPRHGNGATKEVTRATADAWHKNRHFRVDSEVINYLKYRVSAAEWKEWFYVPYKGLDRTNDVVCVPKSMTRNRTISKEPTTLQYLQQDIFQALDDYFRSNLPDRIDLHDQDRSRHLAEVGSINGAYATIDLSAASDSVSLSLIELLFDGLPILYPLLATRSTASHIRDASGTVDVVVDKIEKFAPMGSAVCFPVECIVFATFCEAAVRSISGRRSKRNDYVVYGDDIVIKAEYARRVVELLEKFHFSVNADKSFIDDSPGHHYFREACGIEAFDGVDVTPLRLSRRLVSLTNNEAGHQAGLGVGMVDLVNRLYTYGFWHTRKWVNAKLVAYKWYRTLLRVSASDYAEFTAAVLSSHPSWVRVVMPFVIVDDSTDTQWRSFGSRFKMDGFQSYQAYVTVAKVRPRKQHHDENDYFTWSLDAATRKLADEEMIIDERQIVTFRPHDLQWSKTWVVVSRRPTYPALVKRLK